MDKKDLYEKAEKALNQAFELAKKSVQVVSEKAGEAAHITKLMIEKATLEHRVNQKFTKLGDCVYQKVLSEGNELLGKDSAITALIDETKKLDLELSRVESDLDAARKESGLGKTKS
jgi:hypothetical protein